MAKSKEFYQHWTEQEINEYTDQFSILVLFVVDDVRKEAQIVVHGNLTNEQKDQLTIIITTLFGGTTISRSLCDKINEFAEKWYNKFILKKKARVINFRKEK